MTTADGDVAPDTDTNEDDKPLTKTSLMALLKEALPGVVNSAVTSQLKRATKSFDEKIAALTAKPTTGEEVEETLEVVDPKGAQPAKPKPAGEAVVAKPDPELVALRKSFDKLQKDAADSQKRADAERRQRLESDGHSTVRKAVTGKVIPGAEDAVLAMLRGRNAIAIGDDGAVRLRLGAQGEPEEGLSIDDGIGAFMKSPEAAFFTPAPNGGAGGAKRVTPAGAQTRPGATTASAEQKFEERFKKPLSELI